MILVHDDWYLRELLNCSLDKVLKKIGASVLSSACLCLKYHRTVYIIRSFHDCTQLFKVIHIECRHTVMILSCMVE